MHNALTFAVGICYVVEAADCKSAAVELLIVVSCENEG